MSVRDDILAAEGDLERWTVIDAAFVAAGYTHSGTTLRDQLLAANGAAAVAAVIDAAAVAAEFTVGAVTVRDQLLAAEDEVEWATAIDNLIAAQEEEEAPTYTGPLDLVPSAFAAYSQRAMAAAYVGDAVRIRSSGGGAQNFDVATAHKVDLTAVDTFLGMNNGFTVTAFDQAGNDRDVTNASTDSQSGWDVIAASPLPSIGPRGALGGFEGGAFLTSVFPSGQTFDGSTLFFVFYRSPNTEDGLKSSLTFILDATADGIAVQISEAQVRVSITTDEGNEQASWTANGSYEGLHLIECNVTNAGAVTILVDGVNQNATSEDPPVLLDGVIDTVQILAVGVSSDLNPAVEDAFYEVLPYPLEKSAPNRLSVRQNIQAFYSTPALP